MRTLLATRVGRRVLLQLRGGQHFRGKIEQLLEESNTVVLRMDTGWPEITYIRIEAVDAIGADS